MRSRRLVPVLLVIPLLLAACGDATTSGGTDAAADTGAPPADTGGEDTLPADTSAPADTGGPADTAAPSDADAAPGDTAPADGAGDGGDPCPGCTGSPCDENADCFSGFCIDGPDGLECAQTCDASCPAGYSCKLLTGGSDTVFLCIYDHLPFCRPCDVDGDCANPLAGGAKNRCVPAAPIEGSFCGTECDTASDDCPPGATCVPVALGDATVTLCMPDDGACTCSARAVEESASTTCLREGAAGACEGTRMCSPSGLSACDAPEAVEEVCNDLDDDCDGATDEGLQCETCPDGSPGAQELCDGLDNDCDGATDEDFLPGGTVVYTAADGASTASLGDTCGLGPCAGGTVVCGPNKVSLVCSTFGLAAGEECNGQDDDCDGVADDGLTLSTLAALAEVGCKVKGVCSVGGATKATCADGAWSCTYAAAEYQELEDACDNLDNDCDGQTDGMKVTDAALLGELGCATAGLCAEPGVATAACVTGTWGCAYDSPLYESPEASCDGVDNDCDGGTDDALTPPPNPNQDGACAGTVQVCGPDGWEEDYSAAPQLGQPETPDGLFVDENCDGLDGDVTLAVFVATPGKGGAPGAPCTQAEPCASVNEGVARAVALGRPHVYVQVGTYEEIVELADGVAIYGGFDAAWTRGDHTLDAHRVTILGGLHEGDGEYMAVRARNVTATLADLWLEGVEATTRRATGQGRSSYVVHAKGSNLTLARVEITQRDGMSGEPGADGADAPQAAAPGGTPGEAASLLELLDLCDDSSRGAGGSGAVNASCPGTASGNGGAGGTSATNCTLVIIPFKPIDFASRPGEDGTDAATLGGASGLGGDGGAACFEGGAGQPGVVVDGIGGPGGAPKGRLIGDYWYGFDGGGGGVGGHGGGGGGGGGSGGCDNGITGADSYGGGGGGGGAGGCRAEVAGTGGKGAGGSFGVFAIDSTVSLTVATVVRANGGDGGAGGRAGLGQPGGTGGAGGMNAGGSPKGGKGGDGGHGGHSGGGGGGGGGHSAGIFTLGSTVNVGAGVIFKSGAAGPGGAGGTGPGAAAGDGGGAGLKADAAVCASPGGC